MHCKVIQMFEMVLISLQMSTYGDNSADFGFIPVVDVDRYVKGSSSRRFTQKSLDP